MCNLILLQQLSPFINLMKVEQLETASNWRNFLQPREELDDFKGFKKKVV
jgi:hypothetical protein